MRIFLHTDRGVGGVVGAVVGAARVSFGDIGNVMSKSDLCGGVGVAGRLGCSAVKMCGGWGLMPIIGGSPTRGILKSGVEFFAV